MVSLRKDLGFKYGLLQHYPFVLHLNVMLTSIYEHPSTAKSSVLWAEVKGQLRSASDFDKTIFYALAVKSLVSQIPDMKLHNFSFEK